MMTQIYGLNGKDNQGKTYEGRLVMNSDGTLEGKIRTLPTGLEKEIHGRLIFDNDGEKRKLIMRFEESPGGNVVCEDTDRILFNLEKEVMASDLQELALNDFIGEYNGMFSEVDEDMHDKKIVPKSGSFYLTVSTPEEGYLEKKLNPIDAYTIVEESIEIHEQEAITRMLEREERKEKRIIMRIPLHD